MQNSFILNRCLEVYLSLHNWIWNRLSSSFRLTPLGLAYGRHLHHVARFCAKRRQYFATFFLRNRAELELIRKLLDQKPRGSQVNATVLACSKGAEVYSLVWATRSARMDVRLRVHAVDISQEIVNFAAQGVYTLSSSDARASSNEESVKERGDVSWNTSRDQNAWMFERMTPEEVHAMFEVEGGQAKVRPWLKEGITWMSSDAGDSQLIGSLGLQDLVLANRFLCHMQPPVAEECLRNVARLVKPGGYLFVSGIDLDVRTKVARDLGWKPITDLIREIHDGDVSIRRDWPLEYWGLEPLDDRRTDWRIRYASVFQIPENGSFQGGAEQAGR
jgi:chemotaxis methyl-accepting protein methylase